MVLPPWIVKLQIAFALSTRSPHSPTTKCGDWPCPLCPGWPPDRGWAGPLLKQQNVCQQRKERKRNGNWEDTEKGGGLIQ